MKGKCCVILTLNFKIYSSTLLSALIFLKRILAIPHFLIFNLSIDMNIAESAETCLIFLHCFSAAASFYLPTYFYLHPLLYHHLVILPCSFSSFNCLPSSRSPSSSLFSFSSLSNPLSSLWVVLKTNFFLEAFEMNNKNIHYMCIYLINGSF